MEEISYNITRNDEKVMNSQEIAEIDLTKKELSLNNREWKEFIVEDLFDVKSGSSKTTPEPGDYVIVTGKTTENGINGTYPIYNQENIFTIASVGANCGTSFYHPYKFHLGANVLGLTQKFKANKWIANFICTCLDKLKNKYAYGKTASVGRIKQEKIWLPINENNEPDYQFMEDYMRSLNYEKEEYISNLSR